MTVPYPIAALTAILQAWTPPAQPLPQVASAVDPPRSVPQNPPFMGGAKIPKAVEIWWLPPDPTRFFGGTQPFSQVALNPVFEPKQDNPPITRHARQLATQIPAAWAPPDSELYGRQPGQAQPLGAILASFPTLAAGGWVYHYSGVLLWDSQTGPGAYPDFSIFDNYVVDPVAQTIYEAPGYTTAKLALVRAWASIQATLGLGTTGKINPILQIRYSTTATNDPLFWTNDATNMWGADATTLMWSGISPWTGWTKGTLNTTYVQERVVFNASDGLVVLQTFTPTIDQAFLSDGANGVSVAGGGTRINFANTNFLSAPAVTVTPTTAGSATASSIDTNGFTAHFFNTSGSDVGGVINWSAHLP